jgi:hypothetical protein
VAAIRDEPWPLRRRQEWARRLGTLLLKRTTASWLGSMKDPAEYKVAAEVSARYDGFPLDRALVVEIGTNDRRTERGTRYRFAPVDERVRRYAPARRVASARPCVSRREAVLPRCSKQEHRHEADSAQNWDFCG